MLRRAFAPFDSVGERYAEPAQNARIPSRLHSIEEVPIALGLLVATSGDYAETMLGGVNYGRDSDSIAAMGGALAGALGSPVPRPWIEEIGAASKLDLEEPGRTMAEVAEEIFAKDRARLDERAQAFAQTEAPA
jgi:ADP-ribosylglycohydrolase